MIRVMVTGIPELQAKLTKLGQVGTWGLPIMRKAVLYAHSQVPSYPAPPAGSTYRRTGTLGRSLTTSVKSLSGNEVAGYLGTKTVYAPYVIDEKRQAWMHRGRWWTLQGVVGKAAAGVKRIFEQEIRKLIS
jgi:hypothetical protein